MFCHLIVCGSICHILNEMQLLVFLYMNIRKLVRCMVSKLLYKLGSL